MSITYAKFHSGRPVNCDYTAGSAVSAGDVVVLNSTMPFVSHLDIPAAALGSLAVMGGIYVMTADGAIAPGADVYWDATAHKITLTVSGNTHFGKMLAGPDGLASGVGPATSGDACFVLHDPQAVGAGGSGPDTRSVGASTAAAGSTTSDAGVLPAGTASIYPTTAADDTKGVRIDVADKVTGRKLFIGNGVANKILKVYGPSGATINGGSADAAFSSASGKGITIVCLSGSGNTWLAA